MGLFLFARIEHLSLWRTNERKYERTDRLQLTYDAQEKKLRKSKLGTAFPQKKLEKKELRGFDDV